MNEAVFFGLGLLMGAGVAWTLGVRRGGLRVTKQLAAFVQGLKGGNLPDPSRTSSGEIAELREMRKLLHEGWAPRGSDDEDPARRALTRIAGFLRNRVELPLLEGLDGNTGDLRKGVDSALVAVEDLEFFLEDLPAPEAPSVMNLGSIVQDVTREFAGQSDVMVKVRSPQDAVRVRVEPDPVKDAIFLILHNAAEFGGEQPVDVTVGTEGGRAYLKILDRGPGFTEESLLRCMDPFYSTSLEGLGLGLPHARRALNSQGGEILLRNGKDGGAEVEIRFPLAD